jgi:hypothetical protein
VSDAARALAADKKRNNFKSRNGDARLSPKKELIEYGYKCTFVCRKICSPMRVLFILYFYGEGFTSGK